MTSFFTWSAWKQTRLSCWTHSLYLARDFYQPLGVSTEPRYPISIFSRMVLFILSRGATLQGPTYVVRWSIFVIEFSRVNSLRLVYRLFPIQLESFWTILTRKTGCESPNQ